MSSVPVAPAASVAPAPTGLADSAISPRAFVFEFAGSSVAYAEGEEICAPLAAIVDAAVRAVKPRTNPKLQTTLVVSHQNDGYAVETKSTSSAGKTTAKSAFVPFADVALARGDHPARKKAGKVRGAGNDASASTVVREIPVIVREEVVVERPVEIFREVVREVVREVRVAAECQVCIERSIESVLPCGHIFCGPCAYYSADSGRGCPMCRAPVRAGEIKKVYF